MNKKNIVPSQAHELLFRALSPQQQAKGATLLTTTLAVGGRQALKSAGGRLAVTAIERVAPSVGRSIASGGAKAAGRAVPLLAVAEFGVRQYLTHDAYKNGEIDQREYRRQSGGNVGSVGGGVGGACACAAIGSAIFPGVGTIIGGLLGGIFGSLGGESAGRALGNEW